MSESDDLSGLLDNDAGSELASADNPFAPPSESQPASSRPQASNPLASKPGVHNPSVPTPAPVDVAGAPLPPSMPAAPAALQRREDRTAPLAGPNQPAREEAPSSAMFWRPGTVFAGRYTLLEELGHGGMGRVFKARDMQLTRDVAIKVMRSSMRLHEHAAALTDRFQAEALLPAQINHPNIIAIFDRGTHVIHDEHFPFFVMEFLPSARSLHEEIQTARTAGPLALERIRGWFIQAASALASLHATGAWHRDIKPANFLVYELHDSEHLKLLDFGIAHLPESDLTMDGSILGTPSYMAPEFFEFEDGKSVDLDYRGDLFALGITLYQCLTLQHPYPSVKSTRDALAAYKGGFEVVPPSRHRPGLPHAWDQLTLALLERDRGKRLQPAKAVLAALRQMPIAEAAGAAPVSELLANDAVVLLDNRMSLPSAEALSRASAIAAPPVLLHGASMSPLAGSRDTPSSVGGPSAPPSSPSGPSAAKDGSPASEWANAFRNEAGAPRKRAAGKFVLAGSVLVGVFVLVALIFTSLSGPGQKSGKADNGADAWNMPGDRKAPADAWKQQIDHTPLFPTTHARPPTQQHEEQTQPERVAEVPPAPQPQRENPESTRAQVPKRGGGRASHAPPQPAVPDNPYANFYGSGSANSGAISVQSGGDEAGAGSVKGKRLDACLIDKIASRPSGAAVIVKLTKEAKVGNHTFPVGAEVHGKVTGADGNRIFVAFEFVRFGKDEVVRISGVVRGKDGRTGLPGKKLLDGNAGQSVATAGASSAITGVAGAAAGAIAGPVAGGVVQGVGDSASQKVERLDNDEALVVANGSTPVVVYLTDLPNG